MPSRFDRNGDSSREQTANPGDLGRRVRARRNDLGLDRQAVARRAHMAPGYLEYLEESPGAAINPSSLYRLAAALETTGADLMGQGFGQPQGSGAVPGGSPRFEVLDRAACMELIRAGGIGRVVFDDGRGPIALPVNFRTLDEHLVFQTGHGSIGAAAAAGRPLSFEVDHFDSTLAEGWSVLVRGEAVVVRDADEVQQIDELHIESWAGAPRTTTVRLRAEEMTGRRIRRHL